MPKQAKSSIAKVRHTCQEYPDEFSATPAGDLRCNLCDVLVKCDKTFFVESHRKNKQHQGKSETKSKSQSKRTFLHFDQVNFKEQVVSSFLATDINQSIFWTRLSLGGRGGSSSSWSLQASRSSATKDRCSAGMPSRDQLRST